MPAAAGPLTRDNRELMIDAATRGLGRAYVWDDLATPGLRDGRLCRCLEDWAAPGERLFLYYPSRRHQSAGLRAMVIPSQEQ